MWWSEFGKGIMIPNRLSSEVDMAPTLIQTQLLRRFQRRETHRDDPNCNPNDYRQGYWEGIQDMLEVLAGGQVDPAPLDLPGLKH